VIFFWKDYEPDSVEIAYNELIKRGYAISENFLDKMSEFLKNTISKY